MRIDVDDRLLSEAMRSGCCKTKRATVEEGLRLLARVKGYRAIMELRGTVHWNGDPDALRREKTRAGLKVAKAG
jgi:Arc/MetJ family transcription regulator